MGETKDKPKGVEGGKRLRKRGEEGGLWRKKDKNFHSFAVKVSLSACLTNVWQRGRAVKHQKKKEMVRLSDGERRQSGQRTRHFSNPFITCCCFIYTNKENNSLKRWHAQEPGPSKFKGFNFVPLTTCLWNYCELKACVKGTRQRCFYENKTCICFF